MKSSVLIRMPENEENVFLSRTIQPLYVLMFVCISGMLAAVLNSLLRFLLQKKRRESIFYEGRDIKQPGYDDYRKQKVTMVFQNYNLIPYLNALENIELAMNIRKQKHSFQEAEILALLESMGVDEIKARRKIKELSGGEQQRVAIARALSSPAKLVIADEPTGNLDIRNSQAVMEIFGKLAGEYHKTVIMVTHNKDIAEKSDIEYNICQQDRKLIQI